jgi:hypothetical protein
LVLLLWQTLVREEKRETGIIWDPKLRVEEFIDMIKKLIAFSEIMTKIKQKLAFLT